MTVQRKRVCRQPAQPKQEVALFFSVTIPRLQWINWNKCGNSTLKGGVIQVQVLFRNSEIYEQMARKVVKYKKIQHLVLFFVVFCHYIVYLSLQHFFDYRMLKYPVHFSHWQIFQSPQKEKIGSNCNQQSWETIFLVNKIVMKYVFNEPFSKHNTKADINMHSSRQKVFLAGGFFFYQSSLAHKSKFDPVTRLK